MRIYPKYYGTLVRKKVFLIFLFVIILFFLICFSIKKFSGRKFLESISFENIQSIEISTNNKTFTCDNVELISEFKYIITKIAEGKDTSSKINREMRNVYIFTITKNMAPYRIHISYPNNKEYIYVYIESNKFSTNLCCELQNEDWDVFMHFLNDILQDFS